jgi:hypothetical protein
MTKTADLLESKRSGLREYVEKRQSIVVTETNNAFALAESERQYNAMLKRLKGDFARNQFQRVKNREAALRTLHEGVQKLASGSPRKKLKKTG